MKLFLFLSFSDRWPLARLLSFMYLAVFLGGCSNAVLERVVPRCTVETLYFKFCLESAPVVDGRMGKYLGQEEINRAGNLVME